MLELLPKHCPKWFVKSSIVDKDLQWLPIFHVTYSYNENRGISLGGLLTAMATVHTLAVYVNILYDISLSQDVSNLCCMVND